jgi:hypothetical protein
VDKGQTVRNMMAFSLSEEDIVRVKKLLRSKHLRISAKDVVHKLETIAKSQEVFPLAHQQILMIQLLCNFEKSKRKEVIVVEELDDGNFPLTVVMGVVAEDWPGMSNAILGIVHHKERNVLFMKGFTVELDNEKVGIVILCFQLRTREEYEEFDRGKKKMMSKIREASHGSSGKCAFLEDEAAKFDIYNDILKRFMSLYSNSSLIKIIEESGEVLKFISSRSREYLEERNVKHIAELIINNYIYQNMIRSGVAEEIIRIKNFKTKTRELTGITFLCREGWFSVEDFLLTLNHIVPDHIIKHHKSFVTVDGILVYRLEFVDRNEKPLSANLIKSIERSLEKMVAIAHGKKISKLKAIGGFEHYARAIIPFLTQELKRTKLTQVFIDVARRSEFLINIKLVVVSTKARRKQRVHELNSKVCLIPGVGLISAIPTKIHGNVEINILKLKINLTEFSSIKEIYRSLKSIIKKVYGEIRDFDEGFRDIYISRLNQLLDKLKTTNQALIREIFFNIDELYKIEISLHVIAELIKLCAKAVDRSKKKAAETKAIFNFKNLPEEKRTIVVVSYEMQKRLMSKLIKELKDVDVYFSKIEWNQRSYLMMVLSKNDNVVDKQFISYLKECVTRFC